MSVSLIGQAKTVTVELSAKGHEYKSNIPRVTRIIAQGIIQSIVDTEQSNGIVRTTVMFEGGQWIDYDSDDKATFTTP